MANFKLPEYTGIQTSIVNKENDYSELNISKFQAPTEGDNKSTIFKNTEMGSVNLDALLNRQENRLAKLEK